MVEDFRAKIREYLRFNNPEMSIEEVESKIDSVWEQFNKGNTPNFDKWLKRNAMETAQLQVLRSYVFENLARRNKEGTQEAVHQLVEWITANEFVITLRNDKNPIMYFYNKEIGIYEKQGETKIKIFLEKLLFKAYNTTIAKEVIERIRIKTFVEQEEISKIRDPYIITCGNGVIDLKTLQLKPLSPEPKQFQRIPVNFNEQAKCPHFIEFIEQVLPDEEKRKTIQEYIGYGLLRVNRYEKYVLLYGNGSNGKTLLLNVIKELVGHENVSAVKPQVLSNGRDQYAAADLEVSLFNIAGEISDEAIKDTSIIKESASPEMIRMRNPYEAARTMQPYSKQIWSANKLPKIYDNSDGFWRRIIPIEFNSKFVDEDQISNIKNGLPEYLQDRVYKKKVDLINLLLTKEELEGVLQWALQGLKRLIENGCFTFNEPPQVLRLNYTKKADSISAFFEEVVTEAIDQRSYITKKKFFETYVFYCGMIGVTPSSETKFSIYCKKVENLREERHMDSKIGKGQPWCWLSINEDMLLLRMNEVVKIQQGLQGLTLATSTRSSPEITFNINKGLQPLQVPNCLEQIKSLFSGKYSGQALPIELIQSKVIGANDAVIKHYMDLGEIMESPSGWIRLL